MFTRETLIGTIALISLCGYLGVNAQTESAPEIDPTSAPEYGPQLIPWPLNRVFQCRYFYPYGLQYNYRENAIRWWKQHHNGTFNGTRWWGHRRHHPLPDNTTSIEGPGTFPGWRGAHHFWGRMMNGTEHHWWRRGDNSSSDDMISKWKSHTRHFPHIVCVPYWKYEEQDQFTPEPGSIPTDAPPA